MDDSYDRKSIEDKIEYMRKTIEDLKLKVAEERELLKLEKSENEQMMAEQVRLRKKLSMFHLTHCPAYSSPAPCPIHPHKHLPALSKSHHGNTGSQNNEFGDLHYQYPDHYQKFSNEASKSCMINLNNFLHEDEDGIKYGWNTSKTPVDDLFYNPPVTFPGYPRDLNNEASTSFTLKLSELRRGMETSSDPEGNGQEGDLSEQQHKN